VNDSLHLLLREQMRHRKERVQASLEQLLRRREQLIQQLQALERQCARRQFSAPLSRRPHADFSPAD
jgi:flagellar biosynthesis/type III secretory pathway chaperone